MTGSPLVLILALVLDATIGEPKWLWSRLPHPAVIMGRAVDWVDSRVNRGANRRLKGTLSLIVLLVPAGALGWTLQAWLPGVVVDLIVVAILVAQKSLVEHVSAVATALRESLDAGKRSVAMIVGRDTQQMDTADVSRAAIESAAENFSDGITAPVFWYLLGGLPGILIYKVTNTADSMIGHRTERHEAFGWASARFDDVLNFVPSRITGALVLLSHGHISGWGPVAREARQHRSPNAGWPEAAMARCLNVALSGPRSYEGRVRDFPYINPEGDLTPGPDTIDKAVNALWRSWAGLFLSSLLLLGVAWAF